MCACLAMLCMYLFCGAGDRRLAEKRKEHGKKFAPVQEQLREVAARQAYLAEGMDRVEAGMQRLLHTLDHLSREQNAVTSPPCTAPKAPSSQRLGRKLDHENAAASSPCAASKASSSATNFVRTHYPKMFAEREKVLADGRRERKGCQPQDATRVSPTSTPVPSQSRTSPEPTFRISSGSRFYSYVVKSQARSQSRTDRRTLSN